MHRAKLGSAVSPIMTMPHFALILEITPLKNFECFLQRAHLGEACISIIVVQSLLGAALGLPSVCVCLSVLTVIDVVHLVHCSLSVCICFMQSH